MSEKCMVHLLSKHYKPCNRTDIASYIQVGAKRIPLCTKHHNQICGEKSTWTWSSKTSRIRRKKMK